MVGNINQVSINQSIDHIRHVAKDTKPKETSTQSTPIAIIQICLALIIPISCYILLLSSNVSVVVSVRCRDHSATVMAAPTNPR